MSEVLNEMVELMYLLLVEGVRSKACLKEAQVQVMHETDRVRVVRLGISQRGAPASR